MIPKQNHTLATERLAIHLPIRPRLPETAQQLRHFRHLAHGRQQSAHADVIFRNICGHLVPNRAPWPKRTQHALHCHYMWPIACCLLAHSSPQRLQLPICFCLASAKKSNHRPHASGDVPFKEMVRLSTSHHCTTSLYAAALMSPQPRKDV